MAAANRSDGRRRTAFILAGGASRGSYQAGCLQRLEEEGITPDLIIGSSIGVCNALVYATGGPESLWAFWSRVVSLPHVLDVSLRKNPLFGNSIFSMDRLIRLVESEVDFDRCFNSEIELSFILANLSAGHEEMRGNRTEPDVDRFRTVSQIGYSIPILHPLIELDGDMYADGGFLWNVPFEYAEEWGATDVYILSVVPSKLPRADSLRFMWQVALRMYDVFWRTFGNASMLEKNLGDGEYHGVRVTVIEPDPDTGMFDPLGMINAHPRKSRRLLWQGYRDTDAVLAGERPGAAQMKAAESRGAGEPTASADGGPATRSSRGDGRRKGQRGRAGGGR